MKNKNPVEKLIDKLDKIGFKNGWWDIRELGNKGKELEDKTKK